MRALKNLGSKERYGLYRRDKEPLVTLTTNQEKQLENCVQMRTLYIKMPSKSIEYSTKMNKLFFIIKERSMYQSENE